MAQIKFAVVEDLGRLRECELQIWESLSEWLPDSFVRPNMDYIRRPDYLQNWQEMLQNREVIYLSAEEDKEIIGLATGRAGEGGVGTLGFLGVKKDYRRGGEGSMLLNRFLEEAKKRNAHKVWLFTSPNLHSAIRLYIKTGFVPEGYMRQHSYGLDLIIYSRFLDQQK
ncbi:MAG TPA: GNAT family N-acetyltransferase [Candidatus Bathyarchaeia archaeon]|nr:GNAT family N-acetyltransferase [Candidatus Bathyarchaeia archaeon]